MDRSHGTNAATEASVQRPTFFERCVSIAERNRLHASDYVAEFASVGERSFASVLRGLDLGGVRIAAVRDSGGVRMRAVWGQATLGAAFVWGSGMSVQGARHPAPTLVITGPGTEVATNLVGESRTLRIGLRGAVLDRLRSMPTTAPILERWQHAGVFRPSADPKLEWRVQCRILNAVRLADRCHRERWSATAALRAAGDAVVGELMSALAATGDDAPGDQPAISHRRLVRRALQLLEAFPDEPVAVATVCQELGVTERTLQRAFQDTLGMSLRTYERRRRLRAVHGEILAHGDRRTITEIATSFGFWHLGRFAGAYAATFGCTPAETRRRAWGRDMAIPHDAMAESG